MGSCGCWGTHIRSFSSLGGFGTRVLWVLLSRSCRAGVQGCLLDCWHGSRSLCGVRGAWPALPEPTGASGSSQFSPAPSAASVRSITCHVVTPRLMEGGEEGRCVRPSGGDSWDSKTPSFWFWSIPTCGQYSAFTSRTLSTLLTDYFISLNLLSSFLNYRT